MNYPHAVPLKGTILERHLEENERAELADLRAVQDYNIMMGNIEDPSEEEEDEDE